MKKRKHIKLRKSTTTTTIVFFNSLKLSFIGHPMSQGDICFTIRQLALWLTLSFVYLVSDSFEMSYDSNVLYSSGFSRFLLVYCLAAHFITYFNISTIFFLLFPISFIILAQFYKVYVSDQIIC